MKKEAKFFFDLGIRYLLLIVAAIPNLWIFYFIFTPLTVYPVYFLSKMFSSSFLFENTIVFSGSLIQIIPACIAGSAYYLLLILNLSTPKIKIKKRIIMLGIAFLSFLILNIIRIFALTILFLSGSPLFDITHKLFWYILSIVFVVGIWFVEVKIFKIKEIPFYSDIKSLYNLSSFKRG